MATLAHRPTIYVEAHYGIGAVVGMAAGAIMAMFAMVYTTITGFGFWALGSGISEAFMSVSAAESAGGITIGLGVHMMLSAMLGVFAAYLASDLLKDRVEAGLNLVWVRLGIGAVVFAFNWYVLLPIVDPRFIEIMPHGPALVFHLIFGYSLGLYGRYAIKSD